MTTLSRIEKDAIKLVRSLVIEQARYSMPWDELPYGDDMYDYVDIHITLKMASKYLEGKNIISDEKMLKLANKLGLERLSDEMSCIDIITDYVNANKKDCKELHEFIVNRFTKARKKDDKVT